MRDDEKQILAILAKLYGKEKAAVQKVCRSRSWKVKATRLISDSMRLHLELEGERKAISFRTREELCDLPGAYGEVTGLPIWKQILSNSGRKQLSFVPELTNKLRGLFETWFRRSQDVEEGEVFINDVFGSYSAREKTGVINLYWLPIAVFAKKWGISVESLTKVILVHMAAHACTHIGRDIDDHVWYSDFYQQTDDAIREGIVHFYTSRVLQQIGLDEGREMRFCGKRLARVMPYSGVFKQWGTYWEIGEPIRLAILRLRRSETEDLPTRDEFAGMIRDAANDLKASGPVPGGIEGGK